MSSTEQVTGQETAPAQAVPELTINDLLAIKQVFEVVSNRGAFKANELTSVGVLYDKLSAFLDAATPKAPPAQEQGDQNG